MSTNSGVDLSFPFIDGMFEKLEREKGSVDLIWEHLQAQLRKPRTWLGLIGIPILSLLHPTRLFCRILMTSNGWADLRIDALRVCSTTFPFPRVLILLALRAFINPFFAVKRDWSTAFIEKGKYNHSFYILLRSKSMGIFAFFFILIQPVPFR